MANKILIICDSHGAMWGAKGYAYQIKDKLNCDVELIECGGISLKKVSKKLISIDFNLYDLVLLGLGNVDVHSRMPLKMFKFFNKIGLGFIRDSYFSVPPKINLSYLLRLPFFIIRLFATRFIKESYMANSDIKTTLDEILQKIKQDSNLLILPLFCVNSKVYGKFHNHNCDIINSFLSRKYKEDFLDDKLTDYSVYKKYYNKDCFHFKTNYHDSLSDKIKEKIEMRINDYS